MVYGKACHLPVEIEHKSLWAIKNCHLDLEKAGMLRKLDLNEIQEIRNNAYNNDQIDKSKIKIWHDAQLNH